MAEAVARMSDGGRPGPGPVEVEPVGRVPLAGATGGTWRIRGRLISRAGRETGWSLIVKRIVRSAGAEFRSDNWPAAEEIGHPMYWRREYDFYGSPLAGSLDAPFRAARCFARHEQSPGVAELWLEDLGPVAIPGKDWAIADYRTAAEHLGRFQGRYAATRDPAPLPGDAWLSRGWLRWYISRREQLSPDLCRHADDTGSHLIQALCRAGDFLPAFERLYDLRHRLLDALDCGPQTICHRDFWPPNLFLTSPGHAATVAVDWAYVGIGPLMEDAANIAPDSLFDRYVHADHARALDAAVYDGYVRGLRAAGCALPEDRLRFGYVGFAAVKYFWMPAFMFKLARNEEQARDLGSPSLETVFQQRGQTLALLAEHAGECFALARELGIELG